MSRELKFRAWDPETKIMWCHEELAAADSDGFMSFNSIIGGDSYGLIAMQFTGLRDKNGKDIYEGDVVRWYVNDVTREGIVEYVAESGGYDLKNFRDQYHVCVDWLRGEYEVLGNVHENPELKEAP